MNTKLIALVAIAAGTVAAIAEDIKKGAKFEVPADQAETLLTQGLAELESASLSGASTKAAKTTPARVLQACSLGKPDEVVDVPNDELKGLEAEGLVDSNKAAVAYARNQAQKAAAAAAAAA